MINDPKEELARFLAMLAAQPRFTRIKDPREAVRGAISLLLAAVAEQEPEKGPSPEAEIDAMPPIPGSDLPSPSEDPPAWPLTLDAQTQKFVRKGKDGRPSDSNPEYEHLGERVETREFLDVAIRHLCPSASTTERKKRETEILTKLEQNSWKLPSVFDPNTWNAWFSKIKSLNKSIIREKQSTGGRKGIRRRSTKAKKSASLAKYSQNSA